MKNREWKKFNDEYNVSSFNKNIKTIVLYKIQYGTVV